MTDSLAFPLFLLGSIVVLLVIVTVLAVVSTYIKADPVPSSPSPVRVGRWNVRVQFPEHEVLLQNIKSEAVAERFAEIYRSDPTAGTIDIYPSPPEV